MVGKSRVDFVNEVRAKMDELGMDTEDLGQFLQVPPYTIDQWLATPPPPFIQRGILEEMDRLEPAQVDSLTRLHLLAGAAVRLIRDSISSGSDDCGFRINVEFPEERLTIDYARNWSSAVYVSLELTLSEESLDITITPGVDLSESQHTAREWIVSMGDAEQFLGNLIDLDWLDSAKPIRLSMADTELLELGKQVFEYHPDDDIAVEEWFEVSPSVGDLWLNQE